MTSTVSPPSICVSSTTVEAASAVVALAAVPKPHEFCSAGGHPSPPVEAMGFG